LLFGLTGLADIVPRISAPPLVATNTDGIVFPIFETFERIHQLPCDRSAPENADNAAHSVINLRQPDAFERLMREGLKLPHIIGCAQIGRSSRFNHLSRHQD
jgi:hypothetical protein